MRPKQLAATRMFKVGSFSVLARNAAIKRRRRDQKHQQQLHSE
jgi:hypothetical protein